MREAEFVRLNTKKWERYEASGQAIASLNPDHIAEIYLDVSTDLAFAQTHFAESPVTDYLERIARRFHQHVYGQRPNRWGEVVRTLRYDIPMAFYYSRRELLISLVVFLIATLVGVLTQQMEPDFARQILGNNYVEMTLENIARGDPMAVYKDKDALGMFWGIFFNNALIDVRTFLFGLLALPGALLIILYNGVMFGCFETFLMQHGAVTEALFVVNLHGSLEIPTIVLTGGASLALGTGWLFPGRRSRIEAFRHSAAPHLRGRADRILHHPPHRGTALPACELCHRRIPFSELAHHFPSSKTPSTWPHSIKNAPGAPSFPPLSSRFGNIVATWCCASGR